MNHSTESRSRGRQTGARLFAKRCFDSAIAATVLVGTAPVLAAAALAVRATMGAPVLFIQDRPGRGGRPFRLLKLRTMRHPEPGDRDEDRLTPLGRFLRRTSIDELPQLVNVLRGDMSLVGPRPLLVRYLGRYSPEQARRHDVLPGITGWAQVNGRNALDWPEKLALDVWYVDHWSLRLDAEILVRTLLSVAGGHGVSPADQVIMPEFMGNAAEAS